MTGKGGLLMKKILLSVIIASLLIVPLGGTVMADHEEAVAPVQAQTYLPGDIPAETDAAEAMLPAVHGVLLALLDRDVDTLDREDGALAWIALYNMLSLYGQLDDRADPDSGEFFLPEEAVRDYAAALEIDVDSLPPLPADLQDRINYDNVSHCYVIIRGEKDEAQLRIDRAEDSADGLILTGSLIYDVDGRVLTRFQTTLRPRDTMFGFSVHSLTVSD